MGFQITSSHRSSACRQAFPKSGSWLLPPNYKEYIDISKYDNTEILKIKRKYDYYINDVINTEEEEKEGFFYLYKNIINELNINIDSEYVATKLADEFVYSNEKYELFEDVKENLERLQKKYNIILLSDNWPCVDRIMFLSFNSRDVKNDSTLLYKW